MGDATARDPGLAAGRARPPDRGGDPARPSVCLFTGSRAPSGVGEHMLALAAGLRDRCRVALACPPGPATGPLLERAAALVVEAAAPELGEGRGAAARLAAWLRGRAVDVFHVHAGIGWGGLPGAAAGRAGGARVVLRTEHLPYLLTAPWQRAAPARMLRHLDRLGGGVRGGRGRRPRGCCATGTGWCACPRRRGPATSPPAGRRRCWRWSATASSPALPAAGARRRAPPSGCGRGTGWC